MRLEELHRYAEYGRLYGVRVDVRLMPEYPGFWRTVSFHKRQRVIIEFHACGAGQDEAAFEFVAAFSSLDEAVASVEQYLHAPLQDWTNFNRTGIEHLSFTSDESLAQLVAAGHARLVQDVVHGTIKLPSGAFKCKHHTWATMAEYEVALAQSKQPRLIL